MPSILMPALSPTMEEGKLAKWLKNVGDMVKSGDVIAEIETDKATMEVEAVDEGPLTAILVPAGTENVKVNTPIAVIGEADAAPAPKAGSCGSARRRRRRQLPRRPSPGPDIAATPRRESRSSGRHRDGHDDGARGDPRGDVGRDAPRPGRLPDGRGSGPVPGRLQDLAGHARRVRTASA